MGGRHKRRNGVDANAVLFEEQGTGRTKETSDTVFGGYVGRDRGGTEVS